MKYLKSYEKKYNKIIYKNDEFNIESSDETLFFNSRLLASSTAILCMAMLINNKSSYLNDPELRKIQLNDKHKEYTLNILKLNDQKLQNIVEAKGGQIRYFLGPKFTSSLPDFIIKDLTLKYYPLIIKAVINSKTIGDIIDNFKIIFNEISNEDFEMRKNANKYNL